MAVSPTDVCNMALSHIGSGAKISNVVTDQTAEARACRDFYETTRDSTLSDYRWPWAKKYAALSLVSDDLVNGWAYAYRKPTDCLIEREVEQTFDLNPGIVQREPSSFDVGYDVGGGLIYSDIKDAILCYTPQISNLNLASSNFILALSFRLASYIAPRLTKGDPYKLGARSMQMYMLEIGKASSNAMNVPKPAESALPDMLKARA